ncbi:MAG: DUF86 domain-containing protein [Pedosphaera sp.]|nr:DUF86 domain-containing protein [Pedosphaera sp.]
MKIEVCKRLRDIADCCAAAGRFAAGKTFSDYQADDLLRSAIERKLGIIGEAFAQLEETDPAQAEHFPELRKIIGLRNRIVHGYDKLDEELVWDVVQNRLPALQPQVEALLEAE